MPNRTFWLYFAPFVFVAGLLLFFSSPLRSAVEAMLGVKPLESTAPAPRQEVKRPARLLVINQDSLATMERRDRPTPTETVPTPTQAPTEPTDAQVAPSTLSNELIDDTIATQRNDFQRCQANALREHGSAKGELLVNFVIEPNGQTRDVKILQSKGLPGSLQTCVVTILQRLVFRAFSGAPIERSYPLRFE